MKEYNGGAFMKEKLRIINNLTNVKEHDKVALSGDLKCDCGNEYFKIYHSGKQTKGILAPFLVNKKGQIIIEAQCTCCKKGILIYDNSLDGTKKNNVDRLPLQLFSTLNNDCAYKIHIMYNYYENNFKTNSFEDCFIEINNSRFKKPRRLYEGW